MQPALQFQMSAALSLSHPPPHPAAPVYRPKRTELLVSRALKNLYILCCIRPIKRIACSAIIAAPSRVPVYNRSLSGMAACRSGRLAVYLLVAVKQLTSSSAIADKPRTQYS